MNRYLTYYLAGFRPYIEYDSKIERKTGVIMNPPIKTMRRVTIFV